MRGSEKNRRSSGRGGEGRGVEGLGLRRGNGGMEYESLAGQASNVRAHSHSNGTRRKRPSTVVPFLLLTERRCSSLS